MHAAAMAELDEGRALVEREEALHPVAELAGDMAGIVRERVGGVARLPAADDPAAPAAGPSDRASRTARCRWRCSSSTRRVVEVEPLRIGRAGPLRKDARPGDREPVRRHAERLHRLDVVPVAVIVIGGDVAGVVVVGLARGVREGVPDRGAAAVGVHGAFDLIGGGRRAPEEACWKVAPRVHWDSRWSAAPSLGCALAGAATPRAPALATFARSRRVNRMGMNGSSIGLSGRILAGSKQQAAPIAESGGCGVAISLGHVHRNVRAEPCRSINWQCPMRPSCVASQASVQRGNAFQSARASRVGDARERAGDTRLNRDRRRRTQLSVQQCMRTLEAAIALQTRSPSPRNFGATFAQSDHRTINATSG